MSKHDISMKDGALLVSIIGISSTIGRVVCGYVSDKPWADALKVKHQALHVFIANISEFSLVEPSILNVFIKIKHHFF